MAGIVFHGRNTQIRIYDGTSGGTPPGPYYYQLDWSSAFRATIGRPRGDQQAMLNRGVLDASAHYIQLSDQAILEPQPVSLTVLIDDTQYETLFAALSNIFRASPWTVGNQTWTNTNASTQIRNGDGTLVTTPTTAEPTEDRVNVEVRMIAKSAGATDLVLKWNEVWFPPAQDISEAFEGNSITLSGLWKGDITKAATFTTGTDTTA